MAAWAATYGQVETTPLAEVVSGQSAVGSTTLIGAALAWEWLGGETEPAETLVVSDDQPPAVVFDFVMGQTGLTPMAVTDESNSSGAISEETQDGDLSWLADELLERVFG